LRKLWFEARAARAVLSAIRCHREGRGIAHRDWEKILSAHCISNGTFTDWLTPALRMLNPPRPPSNATGLLGHFSVADQRRIAGQIARDGYYIFENRMPEHVCQAVEDFARTCPALMEDEFGVSNEPAVYDPSRPAARLYKIREKDSLASPAIQSLMADEAFMRIAEAYLQTRAAVGGIDCWWSAPYGNGPSSQAAQLFHFDFDAPPRWLKLFVYVTPVGSDNGPHVYVKGSHRGNLTAGRNLVARGYARIPDADIDEAFGTNAPVEIMGPRGTVFLADTRGFHKGKHPTKGDRLICQLLYCSPVFNNHAPQPEHSASFIPELLSAMRENPTAYARYSSASGA